MYTVLPPERFTNNGSLFLSYMYMLITIHTFICIVEGTRENQSSPYGKKFLVGSTTEEAGFMNIIWCSFPCSLDELLSFSSTDMMSNL